MIIKKIPAGTRIYLTKKNKFSLYIQPNKTITNDNLYVAYDVRVDGVTVIPKGTRVTGDWVTESMPGLAAQLQINWIFLSGSGQEIHADSEIIGCLTNYNGREVGRTPYFYKNKEYKSSGNITRRIAKVGLHHKTLMDNNLDTIYLEISTHEIPVILTEDFIGYQNFDLKNLKSEINAGEIPIIREQRFVNTDEDDMY